YVYLNPYRGAVIAVAEAVRNVSCVGARPLAITNCLNFGNPYNPEVYWTFKQAVLGLGDACRFFNTPVTGGNVSFHNESQNFAVFPTPVIGMLGLIDDISKTCSLEFKNEGDLIFLIGENRLNDLGGSEFLKVMYNLIVGDAPFVDFEHELKLSDFLHLAISEGLINSAHDCSEGGLAICLAEKSVYSKNLGASIDLNLEPKANVLFNESQGRVVVTISPDKKSKLEEAIKQFNLPYQFIGTVKKNIFKIHYGFAFEVSYLQDIYFNQLERYLEQS
ncbi:MAG: AIR synthase related protein, partial [Candidatus Kapaibacteriota bacterium]